MNTLVVVNVIPYRTFKEKIRITKQYQHKGRIYISKGYVQIETDIEEIS